MSLKSSVQQFSVGLKALHTLSFLLFAFQGRRIKIQTGWKVNKYKEDTITFVWVLIRPFSSCSELWRLSYPLNLNDFLRSGKNSCWEESYCTFPFCSFQNTLSPFVNFIILLTHWHRLFHSFHYLIMVLITSGNIFLIMLPAKYQKISSSSGHFKQYNLLTLF